METTQAMPTSHVDRYLYLPWTPISIPENPKGAGDSICLVIMEFRCRRTCRNNQKDPGVKVKAGDIHSLVQPLRVQSDALRRYPGFSIS
jgi:hypothetical protein